MLLKWFCCTTCQYCSWDCRYHLLNISWLASNTCHLSNCGFAAACLFRFQNVCYVLLIRWLELFVYAFIHLWSSNCKSITGYDDLHTVTQIICVALVVLVPWPVLSCRMGIWTARNPTQLKASSLYNCNLCWVGLDSVQGAAYLKHYWLLWKSVKPFSVLLSWLPVSRGNISIYRIKSWLSSHIVGTLSQCAVYIQFSLVWTLSLDWPFCHIQFMGFAPPQCRFGSMLRVVVLLETKPLPKSQVSCRLEQFFF